MQKILVNCKEVFENVWKVCWIEHGKFKHKYFASKKTPRITSFAQIRRKKEISEKELLKLKGLLPKLQEEILNV